MPIKVKCKCGQAFAVKEKYAGKALKCPKCESPIKVPVPKPQGTKSKASAQGAGRSTAVKVRQQKAKATQIAKPADAGGLSSLLDDAGIGIHAAHEGPKCPNCGSPVQSNALICVECGFNSETGEQMKVDADNKEAEQAKLTEGERLVRQAAEEIKDVPIGTVDYGDGVMAYVFTVGLIIATGIALGMAGFMLYLFDNVVGPAFGGAGIAFIVGLAFFVFGRIWLTIAAFTQGLTPGLLLMAGNECGYFFYFCYRYFDKAKAAVLFYFLGVVIMGVGIIVGMSS